jgi:hypothetical protein
MAWVESLAQPPVDSVEDRALTLGGIGSASRTRGQ